MVNFDDLYVDPDQAKYPDLYSIFRLIYTISIAKEMDEAKSNIEISKIFFFKAFLAIKAMTNQKQLYLK